MIVIYKYPLHIASLQVVPLPLGAFILKVAAQRAETVLWAIVDTDAPPVPVEILMIPTGVGINDPELPTLYQYVDTVQLFGETLVYHVFVRPEALTGGVSFRTS